MCFRWLFCLLLLCACVSARADYAVYVGTDGKQYHGLDIYIPYDFSAYSALSNVNYSGTWAITVGGSTSYSGFSGSIPLYAGTIRAYRNSPLSVVGTYTVQCVYLAIGGTQVGFSGGSASANVVSSSTFDTADYGAFNGTTLYTAALSTMSVAVNGTTNFLSTAGGVHALSVKVNGAVVKSTNVTGVTGATTAYGWSLNAYMGDVITVVADGQTVSVTKVAKNPQVIVDNVASVGTVLSGSTGIEVSGTSASGTMPLSNYNGTSGTSSSATLTRGDAFDAFYTAQTNLGNTKADTYQANYAAFYQAGKDLGLGGGSSSGTMAISGTVSTNALTQEQLAAMASTSSVPDATVVNLDTPESTYISGTLAAALSSTNAIESLDGSQSQLLASGSDAQVSFEGKISSFTNQASAIPTSIGTLSSFDLGEVEIVPGYTKSISIDLTKPYVTMGRGALKAVVSLLFFATVLMTVRRFL